MERRTLRSLKLTHFKDDIYSPRKIRGIIREGFLQNVAFSLQTVKLGWPVLTKGKRLVSPTDECKITITQYRHFLTECPYFTGECWSGKDSGRVYNKDGLSRFCITKDFAQCNANDRNACSGNKTTIFVYSIAENYEAQQGIENNVQEQMYIEITENNYL